MQTNLQRKAYILQFIKRRTSAGGPLYVNYSFRYSYLKRCNFARHYQEEKGQNLTKLRLFGNRYRTLILRLRSRFLSKILFIIWFIHHNPLRHTLDPFFSFGGMRPKICYTFCTISASNWKDCPHKSFSEQVDCFFFLYNVNTGKISRHNSAWWKCPSWFEILSLSIKRHTV